MIVVALVAAAALGAVIRFFTEYRLPPVGSTAFPRATLIVNVVGAFILGLLVDAPHDVRIVLGAGLCGALTTFSGVSLQLHRRIFAGSIRAAFSYLTILLAAGLIAAMSGIDLSSRLFS